MSVTAKSDAGLLMMKTDDKNVAKRFMSSCVKHRFPLCETDPLFDNGSANVFDMAPRRDWPEK